MAGGDLSEPKRYIVSYVLMGVLAVAALVGSGWIGYQDRRVAAELRRDGVDAGAEIVDQRYRPRAPMIDDKVKVAFNTATGQRVETWVIVGNALPNGPTRIRYLRDDPTVARLVDDPVPRAPALPLLIMVYAFCVLLGLALFAGFRAIDRGLGLRN